MSTHTLGIPVHCSDLEVKQISVTRKFHRIQNWTSHFSTDRKDHQGSLCNRRMMQPFRPFHRLMSDELGWDGFYWKLSHSSGISRSLCLYVSFCASLCVSVICLSFSFFSFCLLRQSHYVAMSRRPKWPHIPRFPSNSCLLSMRIMGVPPSPAFINTISKEMTLTYPK